MSTTAAYAAGLVDGEGYIGIHSRQRAGGLRYYSGRITVGMTEPALPALEEIRAEWGGSLTKNREETERWAAAWAWSLQGREAVGVCRLLMPYLRVKRQQAAIVIAMEEFKASLPTHRGGLPMWSEDAARTCEMFKVRIHELNTRGPRALSAEVT